MDRAPHFRRRLTADDDELLAVAGCPGAFQVVKDWGGGASQTWTFGWRVMSLATGVVRDRYRDSGRRAVQSALIEMLANLHC